MSDAPEPLLVYNRIEANKRRTRSLLALFAAMMLPFASGATLWLAMPVLSILAVFVLLLMWPLQWLMWFVPNLLPPDLLEGDNIQSLILVEVGLYVAALVMATVGLIAVTMAFIYRYSARMVLRATHARLLTREGELGLHRIVENLCLGAGLPKPELRIIESSTPNAFAVGPDPERAALVVTRGLLTLLDRRELEGVVAHELSHIGNQDVRLNTILAGLVGTLTLPASTILAALRLHPVVPVLAVVIGIPIVSGFLSSAWFALVELPRAFEDTGRTFPPFLWWWGVHALATPIYMVFVAPVVARLLTRGVSREREFLADADAVALTLNPESLARALVKVGSASGTPLRVGPATAHIYFADPIRSDGSWLTEWFHRHPPLEERLDLLLRLGSGIMPSELQEAILTATEQTPTPVPVGATHENAVNSWMARMAPEKAHPVVVALLLLLLLATWPIPFGWIGDIVVLGAAWWVLLRWLGPARRLASPTANQGAAVSTTPSPQRASFNGLVGRSTVATGDMEGNVDTMPTADSVSHTASRWESPGQVVLAAEAALGHKLRVSDSGTVLYSKPDGWSPVVDQLAPETVITLDAWDRGFVKVTTEHGSVGYLGRRTRLVPMVDRA